MANKAYIENVKENSHDVMTRIFEKTCNRPAIKQYVLFCWNILTRDLSTCDIMRSLMKITPLNVDDYALAIEVLEMTLEAMSDKLGLVDSEVVWRVEDVLLLIELKP
jgi:hypothetical protein